MRIIASRAVSAGGDATAGKGYIGTPGSGSSVLAIYGFADASAESPTTVANSKSPSATAIGMHYVEALASRLWRVTRSVPPSPRRGPGT